MAQKGRDRIKHHLFLIHCLFISSSSSHKSKQAENMKENEKITTSHSNATVSIFGRLISYLVPGKLFVKQDFGVVSYTGFKPGIRPHKNQDGFVIFTPTHGVFKNKSNGRSTKDKKDMNSNQVLNTRVYAVLDGHGNAGEIMSAKARDLLLEYVLSKKPWEYEKSDIYYYEIFDKIQKRLEEEHGLDVDCSGTTCTVVSITGNKLQVANVGDSRAFLARTDTETGKVIAVPLTFEHTLDKEQEITRVKAKGGKVYAHEGKPSDPKKGSDSTTRRNSIRRNSVRRNSVKKTAPLRIWYKVGSSSKESGPSRRLSFTRRGSVCNTIGLAMTRSLGDKLAHDTSGVISEPSVFEFEINLDLDHYIVIGSDGVWDMTTYAEAMASVEEDIANNGKSWSPQRAAELLVENARLKWENQSRSIDDITCCIIKLNM